MLRRIATLLGQLSRLDSVRPSLRTLDDSIDAAMIDGAIRSELQDESDIKSWQTNPTNYVGLAGSAVDLLMKRNFAPPAQRLASVTARLRGIPAVLAAMRANVSDPPKEFADLAVRVAQGSVGFFKGDVATWAHDAAGTDTAALRAFTAVNDSVVVAMQSAATWLEKDLLPKAHGNFAIGAQAFSNKLRYDEMTDTPLDKLLVLGQANLDKDYKDFVATAQKVAPGKSVHQAYATLEADHPTADSLISSAKVTVEGTRQFLIDHQIVDIPSEVRPIVTETPPYARNGSFASMDTPGAYETKATEAFYYVTPPEKNWDAKHIEEHLRLFNPSVMKLITVHEVFPGHYLQFIYAKQFPTKTRKLLAANSNVEGWAHYGEQMMVDEGFGGGDPKVRLAQLEEALLRDCRWVVGMKEHTQGMTVEQGAKLFVDKCFQEPANGYEEARRGAYNPTYLYYTLGKLEILKEAPRRLQEGEGHDVHLARLPRPVRETGRRAHPAHPSHHVAGRQGTSPLASDPATSLLGAQRRRRIHARRAQRGRERGEHRDAQQRRGHRRHHDRIPRPNVVEQRADQPAARQREDDADRHTDSDDTHSVADDETEHARRPRAERDAQAELASALTDCIRDRAVHADRRDHERQQPERGEQFGAELPGMILRRDPVAGHLRLHRRAGNLGGEDGRQLMHDRRHGRFIHAHHEHAAHQEMNTWQNLSEAGCSTAARPAR